MNLYHFPPKKVNTAVFDVSLGQQRLHLLNLNPHTLMSPPLLFLSFESSRSVAGYLRRHDPLPLGDELAVGAVTVPPVAEALVALQGRRDAVVPAAGAHGRPGGLVGRGRRGGRPGARRPHHHLLALRVHGLCSGRNNNNKKKTFW